MATKLGQIRKSKDLLLRKMKGNQGGVTYQELMNAIPDLFPDPAPDEEIVLPNISDIAGIEQPNFTAEDVEKTISFAKRSTAPGASGIGIAYVKGLLHNKQFINMLKDVYEQLLINPSTM